MGSLIYYGFGGARNSLDCGVRGGKLHRMTDGPIS